MSEQILYFKRLLKQLSIKIDLCAREIESRQSQEADIVFNSSLANTEVRLDLFEISNYVKTFCGICKKMMFPRDKFYKLSKVAVIQQLNKIPDLIEITGATPYESYSTFLDLIVHGKSVKRVCQKISDGTGGERKRIDLYDLYIWLLKTKMIHFYNSVIWVLKDSQGNIGKEFIEYSLLDFDPLQKSETEIAVIVIPQNQNQEVQYEARETQDVISINGVEFENDFTKPIMYPHQVMESIGEMNEEIQTAAKQNKQPIYIFESEEDTQSIHPIHMKLPKLNVRTISNRNAGKRLDNQIIQFRKQW